MELPSFKNVGFEWEKKIFQIEATQTMKIEIMIKINPIRKAKYTEKIKKKNKIFI